MKLGFVTAILPELNLDQVLAFAAREGFDCVEVMCLSLIHISEPTRPY